MSIVTTEIESVHGAASEQRLVYYRCQDSQGNWHSYGPVISNDPLFDPNSMKQVVAERVAEYLAEMEVQQLLE